MDMKQDADLLVPETRDDGAPESEGDEAVPYGLSDQDIAEILDALHNGYEEAVVKILHDLKPADAAELLSKIGADNRRLLLSRHGAAFHPETFVELDFNLRGAVLKEMTPQNIASILSELDSDDALDMILDLEPDFQREIIRKLSARTRLALQEGLNFPEDSAGRLMQREFVAIPQFWTVGKTIDYMRAAAGELPDNFFDVFVITPSYNVVGEIPLHRLVRAMRSEKLESLKLDEIHPIPSTMDQEEVAQIFRRENLVSAPVVDEEGRLMGVITVDDIVDVIHEEAQEDIFKLSGIEEGGDLYRSAVATSKSRFSWLFINLLTAILASTVISLFDASIEKIVALAILMPIVASMGGNAGTQTLAITVRAMALRELSSANTWRLIGKEFLVGTLNGTWFAFILGASGAWWFHNPLLGVAMGGAIIINLVAAGLSGVAVPIVLERMGTDPAVSSTVILTTVTDVVGFFSFLGLATILLL